MPVFSLAVARTVVSPSVVAGFSTWARRRGVAGLASVSGLVAAVALLAVVALSDLARGVRVRGVGVGFAGS